MKTDQGRARRQTWSHVSVRERRARSYQIGKSNDESSRTAHTALFHSVTFYSKSNHTTVVSQQ